MNDSIKKKNFFIAAISGVVPLTISLPFDYVKIQIQSMAEGHRHYRSHPITLAKEIFKARGVIEFYKGFTGAVYKQMISAGIRLGVYRTVIDKCQEASPSGTVSIYTRIFFSLLFGAVGAWAATPFDLAVIRLQSDRLLLETEKRNYKGTFDALSHIVHEKGLRGCWNGHLPNALKGSILNSVSIIFYDAIKLHLDSLHGYSHSHRIYSSLITSMLVCISTLPVDNLKTKFQKMVAGKDGKYPYKNLTDCAIKSVRTEGFLGLYVGFAVYAIRVAPHAILTMLIQDILHSTIE
jgi:solute carrier family 25 (mitochondrial oxoglutarate transporter), member 11